MDNGSGGKSSAEKSFVEKRLTNGTVVSNLEREEFGCELSGAMPALAT